MAPTITGIAGVVVTAWATPAATGAAATAWAAPAATGAAASAWATPAATRAAAATARPGLRGARSRANCQTENGRATH